jgi:glucose-6-phosphate isomerase
LNIFAKLNMLSVFTHFSVELGKQLAKVIHDELMSATTEVNSHDSSTNALINMVKTYKC